MSKSICALARMECPKTGDPTAKVFCPNWVTGVVENEKDGSGRLVSTLTYTGCQLPKIIPYMVSVTSEVDHAHAAANQARDAANNLTAELCSQENRLRAAILPALLGGISLGEVGIQRALGESSLLDADVSDRI